MLGGDTFSGLIVRAATVPGLSAGSVARLAFSLSLGAASSSRRIFFGSDGGSSERLVSSESLLLASRLLPDETDLAVSSTSFDVLELQTTTSSSTSFLADFGLDSCALFVVLPAPVVPP